MTTTTTLTAFTSIEGHALRTLTRDGVPWFVAADVCAALAIKNHRDAIAKLDDDEKGVALTDTLGGAQEVIVINEPGLYTLVLRSRKAGARIFKKWVTGTVLPSLRKFGTYVVGQERADVAAMSHTEYAAYRQELRAKLDAVEDARWQASREEKQARSDALRFLKGKAPRQSAIANQRRNGGRRS